MDPLFVTVLVLGSAIVLGLIARDERHSRIRSENARLKDENRRLRRTITTTPRKTPYHD